LLGRNRPAIAIVGPAGKFQCPEGLLLGRNVYFVDDGQGHIKVFQCPEGLLLGRN
jgi:hypothetical protein